jgi:Mn-dependent DtxR family transcriptional regulator
MTTTAGKEVAIAYVTKTDTWERLYLSQDTKDEFAEVAQKYKDTLKPDTVKVAMK